MKKDKSEKDSIRVEFLPHEIIGITIINDYAISKIDFGLTDPNKKRESDDMAVEEIEDYENEGPL